MRFVSIEGLEEGMILGRDIYDDQNRIILTRGQVLNSGYIVGLMNQGFTGAYIEDAYSAGIEVHRAISPRVRLEAIDAFKREDLDRCKEIAVEMVGEIIERGMANIDFKDLKSYSNHTYSHSVNVAITCCLMGIARGFNDTDLYDLCVAALLHDLGKLHIPDDIINKPGKLTKDEYEIVKTHPVISYNLVKDNPAIAMESKTAILFHHENVDGSGYPKGVGKVEMTHFTNILHVADVFDALTASRPYKEPYSPFEACEYLMGGCGIMFDKATVELLTRAVPLYPKGTEVLLSNGMRGLIFDNTGVHNLRPITRLPNGSSIDLAQRQNLSIAIKAATDDLIEEAEALRSEEKALVYIVDDMATNIAMLEEILEKKYDVVSFSGGEEIVEKLPSIAKPDVILMDIDMPGMHGIEAAEIISKKIDENIPILFVSALCNVETVMEVKRLNAAGYVLRPYNNMYILGEIDRIINNYGEY